jgi:hypothetical protein
MTEQELRALVRDAVARHLHATPAHTAHAPAMSAVRAEVVSAHLHLSHAQFALSNPNADDACVVEPAAPCSHCGFCKSYGH